MSQLIQNRYSDARQLKLHRNCFLKALIPRVLFDCILWVSVIFTMVLSINLFWYFLHTYPLFIVGEYLMIFHGLYRGVNMASQDEL
jgi:hypothetical protein